jgi:hypothetical protein
MKFHLLFFPDSCFTCVPEAYICASPSIRYDKPDPRSDYILLTSESTSETECHRQIDALIKELQKLKISASKKFRNQKAKGAKIGGKHYWPKALKPIPRPGDARYEYLRKKHG